METFNAVQLETISWKYGNSLSSQCGLNKWQYMYEIMESAFWNMETKYMEK